jgi:hypothetical protein
VGFRRLRNVEKNVEDRGLVVSVTTSPLGTSFINFGREYPIRRSLRSLQPIQNWRLTGGSPVQDYTSGAFDGYDKEDIAGLLEDRLGKARERLEETREAVKALCKLVEEPKDTLADLRYFYAKDSGNAGYSLVREPAR